MTRNYTPKFMRYTPLHALKFGQVFKDLTPDAVRLCTFSFKYPIAVLKIVLATMGQGRAAI